MLVDGVSLTEIDPAAWRDRMPAGLPDLRGWPDVAGGRITEQGSQCEQLRAGGRYAELLEMQACAYR